MDLILSVTLSTWHCRALVAAWAALRRPGQGPVRLYGGPAFE
jgi:hypothetical protein